MTPDPATTILLALATLISGAAAVAALRQILAVNPGAWARPLARGGVIAVTVLCVGLGVYRALAFPGEWGPLQSHADGLTFLAALLGAVIAWTQWRRSLPGTGAFALPLLTLLLLWAVCASRWTLHPFTVDSLWKMVHLASVYLGTLGIAAAAAAGALWLYLDIQLRRKDHQAQRLARLGRLGDLESVERAVVLWSTIGFGLLTVALGTGLVVAYAGESLLGRTWWASPKVILSAAVWGIFAVVMHVRFVPTFRGRRAAILAILGFLLLVVVFGIASVLAGNSAKTEIRIAAPQPPDGGAP